MRKALHLKRDSQFDPLVGIFVPFFDRTTNPIMRFIISWQSVATSLESRPCRVTKHHIEEPGSVDTIVLVSQNNLKSALGIFQRLTVDRSKPIHLTTRDIFVNYIPSFDRYQNHFHDHEVIRASLIIFASRSKAQEPSIRY